jgi:protein-tyrosine phosphatase
MRLEDEAKYEQNRTCTEHHKLFDLVYLVLLPNEAAVAKFLAMAETLSGAVAVHCASGLGRARTLVGLYLMKHHKFTAREAMDWLRIVRSGRRASLCETVQVRERIQPDPTACWDGR